MSLDSRKMSEFLRLARAGAPTVEKKKVVKKGDDLTVVRAAVRPKPTTPAGTAEAPPAGSSGAPETQPPPRLPDPDKPKPNDHPEETPSVEPGPVAEPGQQPPAEDAAPPAPAEGAPKDVKFTPAEQKIRDAAQALSDAKLQGDDKAIAKARTVLVEALRKVGSGG